MRKSGAGKLLIILEILILAAVLAVGVLHTFRSGTKEKGAQSDTMENDGTAAEMPAEESETEEADTEVSSEPEAFIFSDEVSAKLQSMTLEEKAAQMFLVSPEDLMNIGKVTQAGSGTKNTIEEYPVGGFFYSSQNFIDADQTRKMLEGVQSYMQDRIGFAAFLAVEELGGEEHSPLAKANNYEIAESPSVVGASEDASAAYTASGSIAAYLAEEGFNLVLGPVADLSDSDPRSYGTDSKQVTMMVSESISAFHEAGIGTGVSSFPEDPASDLISYKAAVTGNAECLILDEESSFDAERVSYLRKELGYHGIVMTAYFSGENITERYSAAEAAVAAINAGADLIYAPADFREAYQGLLEAVESGEISEERINEAVGYILTVKMQ